MRWAVLLVVLLAAATIALGVGAVHITPADVVRALAGRADATLSTIIRNVRLPRVVLGVGAGAALSMSGATLQGVLRNPLAEPYLLGVSGGAAVGAVVVTSAGVGAPAVIALAAFVGAAGAIVLVLAIARAAGGKFDPRVLLMAGVVVGAFANAAIMIALANAPGNNVRGALWWMMGSLGDASWRDVTWLLPAVSVLAMLVFVRARDIDALALGEEAAAGLGVDVDRSARSIFLTASLLAAATVAAAGLIGFVGLVVPALARTMGARRARDLLAASALIGGALLVLADAVARTLRAPAELPVGAVTALVGVPFFLVRLGRVR
ncbi:MAG TPA: iron ABC transporter permease [Gemmatimonadaceae bacterium]|nr:iron ABC transporter permease [Gemmatimonadaceae bacterium]